MSHGEVLGQRLNEAQSKREAAIQRLVEAAQSLKNECRGLLSREIELREIFGNTNVACFLSRVEDVERVLEEREPLDHE